jgi:hypothetical protein
MGEQARNGMGMHIFDLSEKQMIESQKVHTPECHYKAMLTN